MSIDYTAILVAKYPGTLWSLNGDTYDGLDWQDASRKPTQAELDALWLQVVYENQVAEVEAARLAAYKKECDPLYFKWQRGDATEAEWLAAVAKVKTANPYPSPPTA